MNILKVNNLTKRFKNFTAVDNVSFELKEGEILGLLGPNGAGKTTTIQMLLGVMTPTEGSIFYFDKNLKNHHSEIMEKINFSSTYISIPWYVSVMDNLKVFAGIYGIKDKDKRINKLLEIFECGHLKKKSFGSLSAGEKTKILLTKAFLNFPKVILLDEPTASLDPDIAKKIRVFLAKEKKEFNVSVLLTSHNMDEVEELCDRVIFLNHGKIISENTPKEISRNIKDTILQLKIDQNKEKAVSFFKSKNLSVTENNFTEIEVKEEELPKLIKEMVENKIDYSEINIMKPDLEDFFLHMVKNNENT